jgi:hypothetical protein
MICPVAPDVMPFPSVMFVGISIDTGGVPVPTLIVSVPPRRTIHRRPPSLR